MELDIFGRTALLVGEQAMKRISRARIIIFGVGGVGSWTAECLVRTGVKDLTIVDSDRVSATNVNRQMPATSLTIGEIKTEVARKRLLEINPDADIKTIPLFYDENTARDIDLTQYDYIVDAIDSLKDKALLILNATASGKKFFSSMGAALKIDPGKVRTAEFWDVKGCPLARALRQKFKKERRFPARKFKCVYSDELLANKGESGESPDRYKASVNGSLCHITAIFGMTIAGMIIKDIADNI